MGSRLSLANSWIGFFLDYGSLFLVIFDLDLSRNLMKFSQMIRFYGRISLLNINAGKLLSNFFMQNTRFYDPKSSMTSEERTIHSQGSSGKFFARNLPLESLEFLKLKLALYSISWLFKMLGWALIMKVKKEGGFSKTSLMLIHVFQKIHIVTFNLVALDQVMYGLRHLFQSRGLPLWKSGINIVLTVALCYDFVEF